MSNCKCNQLTTSIQTIDMGSKEQNLLNTYTEVVRRGGKYWWLYMSQCGICKKYLLIGQEERQNDIYCLLLLTNEQSTNIIENNTWPSDFDSYEILLEIGLNAGKCFVHDNPYEGTVSRIMEDIFLDNPNIELSKLAKLLNLDLPTTKKIWEDSQLPNNKTELIHMLNEWDPLGILPFEGGPEDEYNCFIEPILSLLYENKDIENLILFLNKHLEDHMGLNSKNLKTEEFANRIMNWWKQKIK